jgi:lysophospholipase L1-like esterase
MMLQASAQAPVPVTTCPEMATALRQLLARDARMRDWPGLDRYRQENERLAPPAAGASRIVFMGDSITDFWPRRSAFFPGKPYVDRGISGQTTPQMLVRFRPDVIDLKPTLVVILAGTNDIAGNTGPMTDEEIEGNLASMSELARAHGIKVILSSILPVSESHPQPEMAPQTVQRPMSRIRAINDWMKKYAADNGHVYLDYFSKMIDANGLLLPELSEDDLHPNAKGYAIMESLAQTAIDQALAR